jgi:putative hydrolase of the HAD superfamily
MDFEAFYASVTTFDPEVNWIRGVDGVVKQMGIHETAAAVTAMKLWLFEGCEHLVQPFAGCGDFFAASPAMRFGVVTNGPIRPQTIKFQALKLETHFHPELFITSEHAGCFKPDPAIFRYALERAGVEAHEAVHIGDAPEIDVLGAQAAGMRGVWFNPAGKPAPQGIAPDATIATYAELPSLLAGWSE